MKSNERAEPHIRLLIRFGSHLFGLESSTTNASVLRPLIARSANGSMNDGAAAT
jgi:hypothetical protein